MKTYTVVHEQKPEGFTAKVGASGCYLEWENKILLLKQAAHSLEQATWGVPGGKIEKNESPLDTAVRELFEETGIQLHTTEQIRALGALYVSKPDIDYIYHLFKVDVNERPTIFLSNEHTDFRWISWDELPHLHIRSGAEDSFQFYLKKRGNS